jgi:Xaa-Pro dipeptidase
MLSPDLSRQRQKRLLDSLQGKRFDALIIGLPHHVYYLSAFLPRWHHHAAMVLAGAKSLLVAPNGKPSSAAADEVRPYEANWMGTLRQEQPATIADVIAEHLRSRGVRRIGADASPVAHEVALRFQAEWEAIDPVLWQQRRAKDADELELMKVAIRCADAMYRRARQIIEPGIQELRVFNELQAAAVETAGEPMSALLGNDFACGVPGGAPRKDRAAKAGELYILDLGPAYRGYFADNSRAISVDRKPTDAQLRTWQAVTGALGVVERLAKPGVRCQDLFRAASEHLQQALGKPLPHHLGHGVGLQPHEYPHLNLKWDDVLIEGEVFTAEPGIYSPELAGGMRLENQYLVTAGGVENLTPFPLELT